jgi:hypothetical protein
MKTNAVVLIVSAGVGAALVGVGACSSMTGNKPKKVVIEDARIFIPGNAITKDDQDSVSAILRQYRKSLYKVQTFQDGNPSGKAKGTLADEIIGTATVAQVKSDAKQNALSGWGIQIGSSTSSHPTNHPSPTPRPSGSPSHPTTLANAAHPQRPPRNADEDTSREMVAKIAPILRKYSQ